MLWMRKVTGEDVRSAFLWLSKDPPSPHSFVHVQKVRRNHEIGKETVKKARAGA